MIYKKIIDDIKETYLRNSFPWVIGFSGGKDSTALLQFIFYALKTLPGNKLKKELHVISNDTLVENPMIIEYIDKQLMFIKKAGKEQLFKHNPLLFNVKKVTPKIEDTFWVNLIGRGYPSPNRWFRWCTDRLKIKPTNDYIINTFGNSKTVIVILGIRSSESANRAISIRNHRKGGRYLKHKSRNLKVFAPIADLSNNDVWAYLLTSPNPWGYDNHNLLNLYRNASRGGECPYVIDIKQQSCGKSRFGCWVCTVVDKDVSMENIIDNGEEKMQILLDFRNWLFDIRQQKNQYVPKSVENKVKFGAFLLRTRLEILTKLLKIQESLNFDLISKEELAYINYLLKIEYKTEAIDGMKQFKFRLANGKKYTAISDYNIITSPRKRLGPLHLGECKLLKVRKASPLYLDSKRVMYYEEKQL